MTIKKSEIIQIAKKLKEYVETNKKIPGTLLGYNYAEYGYLLAKAINNLNKDLNIKKLSKAPSPTGDSMDDTIMKSKYLNLAKTVESFFESHNRCPNYIQYASKKIRPKVFIYAFAKIIVFYNNNQRLPDTCLFTSKVFKTSTNSSTKGGVVCKAISKATGIIITDYKTLYKAFNYFKYQYYYNDMKTQKKTLSDKAGNCADLNQLAYFALKELNYTVDIVRGNVKCTTGTFGHIWCRLHLKTGTIIFDASAAAKGKSLGTLICGVGTVTNVNPSWLLSDDGRT